MDDLINRQATYDTLTDYYHHTTDIQHKALRDALSKVPSAQQWIPCSERMPKTDENVLVCTDDGSITDGYLCTDGYGWFISCGEDYATNNQIVAWMPLPEPYKEGD